MIFSEEIKIFLLALVQGLSEFLPISSSGHLQLANSLWNLSPLNLSLILTLHLGTLMSLLTYYKKDIFQLTKDFYKKPLDVHGPVRVIYLLAFASLPSLIGAFFLKSAIEKSFLQTSWLALAFFLTGVILFATRFIPNKKQQNSQPNEVVRKDWKKVSFLQALLIGVAQLLAFFPGMSRSGWTISVALFSGLSREQAVSFSFLMAIPVIAGAFLFELLSQKMNFLALSHFFLAFFTSWFFGYLAVKWVLCSIKSLSFHFFAFYLWSLSLLVLLKE